MKCTKTFLQLVVLGVRGRCRSADSDNRSVVKRCVDCGRIGSRSVVDYGSHCSATMFTCSDPGNNVVQAFA